MGNNVTTKIKIPENPTILAYLAGIIDGEGCIRITTPNTTKRYAGSITLQIANTNSKLMTWLQEYLGGSVRSGHRLSQKHKDLFTWVIMGDNAANVLKAVVPFLILKQEQANIALAYHALKRSGGRRSLPSKLIEARIELHTQIQVLNKRGTLAVAA